LLLSLDAGCGREMQEIPAEGSQQLTLVTFTHLARGW